MHFSVVRFTAGFGFGFGMSPRLLAECFTALENVGVVRTDVPVA